MQADALVTSVQHSIVSQADLNDVIQEMIDYMGEPGYRIVEVMAFTPGRSMMHSLTTELMASMMLAKTVESEDLFRDSVARLCRNDVPRGIGIRCLDDVVVTFVDAAIKKDREEEAVIDAAIDPLILNSRMEYVKSRILSTISEPEPVSARAFAR